MDKQSIMSSYRRMLQRGLADVQELAKRPGADEEKVRTAFGEYETLLRIMDAMAPEQDWPFELDFSRLHAIAQAAGASDQTMLRFVINYHKYANEMALAVFRQQHEAGDRPESRPNSG